MVGGPNPKQRRQATAKMSHASAGLGQAEDKNCGPCLGSGADKIDRGKQRTELERERPKSIGYRKEKTTRDKNVPFRGVFPTTM